MSMNCPTCGGEPPLMRELMRILYLGVHADILRIDSEHKDNAYVAEDHNQSQSEIAIMHFSINGSKEYQITLQRID